MAKTDEAALRQIESDYEKACNAWVRELARMWGQDYMEGCWIGDEPGGVYDFNGECPLDMQDIIYIVRNGITYDQASDWQEYVSWIAGYEEYGYEVPTLREYVEYLVPLLDQEARQRIDEGRKHMEDLKADFARLCGEELAKARREFADSQNMTRNVKD